MFARFNSAGQRIDDRGRFTGTRRRHVGSIADDMVPNTGGGFVGKSNVYRNARGQYAKMPKVVIGKNYGMTSQQVNRWRNRTSGGKVVGRSAIVNSRVDPSGVRTSGVGVTARNTRAERYISSKSKQVARSVARTEAKAARQAARSSSNINKLSPRGRTGLVIGAAVTGAAAFAAFRSSQRSARDLNQTLGNPASNVTAWTTYNRTNRGY